MLVMVAVDAAHFGTDPNADFVTSNERAATRAGYAPGGASSPRHAECPTVEGVSTQEGGGGTARLNPGESSRLDKFIVVSGQDSDWLGTRLDVFVNAKKGAADGKPPITDVGNTRTLRYSMPIGALRADAPVSPTPLEVPPAPRAVTAGSAARRAGSR